MTINYYPEIWELVRTGKKGAMSAREVAEVAKGYDMNLDFTRLSEQIRRYFNLPTGQALKERLYFEERHKVELKQQRAGKYNVYWAEPKK